MEKRGTNSEKKNRKRQKLYYLKRNLTGIVKENEDYEPRLLGRLADLDLTGIPRLQLGHIIRDLIRGGYLFRVGVGQSATSDRNRRSPYVWRRFLRKCF